MQKFHPVSRTVHQFWITKSRRSSCHLLKIQKSWEEPHSFQVCDSIVLFNLTYHFECTLLYLNLLFAFSLYLSWVGFYKCSFSVFILQFLNLLFLTLLTHRFSPFIPILLLLFICSHSLFWPYLLIGLDLKDCILCALHLAMFWEFHMGTLYLYYFQSFFSPHFLLYPSLTIFPEVHDLITYSFLIVMCMLEKHTYSHIYMCI